MSNERVMTPKFRATFVNVFEENEKGKRTICMLFDKKTTNLDELKELAKNVANDKYGDKIPKKFKFPFKDGDDSDNYDPEQYPDFAGNYVMNASTKFKVGVVDESATPIIDQSEFYSGCYARATVQMGCYDVDGNKGVCVYLQNVQKLADGDSMGGARRAEDEFTSVVTEEEVSGFDI